MSHKTPVTLMYPIPGGMYPGRMIKLKGTTPPGSVDRFDINLHCGPDTDKGDIAFHLSNRFTELVRNHRAGEWGTEEREGAGPPIPPGARFEMLLLCETDKYKVDVNGENFCEFQHRLPFDKVTHLDLSGDIDFQLIGFDGDQPPPTRMEAGMVFPIPGGVYPDRVLIVRGTITPNAERFIIALKCGSNIVTKPYDDSAFHMHFRFNDQCVVRSHRSGEKWGKNEPDGGMPLEPGQAFELMIECAPLEFKVVINKQPFCEFAHRIPFYKITHLAAERDVRIEELSWKPLRSIKKSH